MRRARDSRSSRVRSVSATRSGCVGSYRYASRWTPVPQPVVRAIAEISAPRTRPTW